MKIKLLQEETRDSLKRIHSDFYSIRLWLARDGIDSHIHLCNGEMREIFYRVRNHLRSIASRTRREVFYTNFDKDHTYYFVTPSEEYLKKLLDRYYSVDIPIHNVMRL